MRGNILQGIRSAGYDFFLKPQVAMRIFCASLVCIIFFFSPFLVCQELRAYSLSYYACFYGVNNTFFLIQNIYCIGATHRVSYPRIFFCLSLGDETLFSFYLNQHIQAITIHVHSFMFAFVSKVKGRHKSYYADDM